MQPLEIKQDRVDAAQRVLGEKIKQLNDPEIMTLMIASELNLYDGVKYDEDGLLTFDLTDLQLVALAAGTAAVAEVGGYLQGNELLRTRVRIQFQKVEYPEKVDV